VRETGNEFKFLEITIASASLIPRRFWVSTETKKARSGGSSGGREEKRGGNHLEARLFADSGSKET